jgi:murein DD-endopeptidase MepM/ murein hydrolase activator NlpD
MVESGRMKETIEYETIKKDSDEYYKGDTHTQQEGIDGIQIFEGTLTKVSGEVTKRKTDNIEVIREKQDKIILIGTKERPKTAPTGTYAMPIYSYTLTSNFGYRWGRLHSGIDMGAPTATPIYASDGGTVVRAGWYAGYGLCVDIDHENGRLTRYGHCSKLLVNVGDKVYQGQNISLVGNTGHSFGSHLHFEVRQNDVPTDPRPILGI